jgi:hypothetical protein
MKYEGDNEHGKRYDDHILYQILRTWPIIAAVVTACWILYEKMDGKFGTIEGRLSAIEIHEAVRDDQIANIQENVKLLIKR